MMDKEELFDIAQAVKAKERREARKAARISALMDEAIFWMEMAIPFESSSDPDNIMRMQLIDLILEPIFQELNELTISMMSETIPSSPLSVSIGTSPMVHAMPIRDSRMWLAEAVSLFSSRPLVGSFASIFAREGIPEVMGGRVKEKKRKQPSYHQCVRGEPFPKRRDFGGRFFQHGQIVRQRKNWEPR